MEFKLLGPVEIIGDTGQPLTLARARERCLLAVLLLNAGQALSAGKLISCIQDDDQGMAEATFRTYLSHVKGVVDAMGGQAQLTAREGGYQLRVPPDSVDVHRFTRLRHQADAAARSGNIDQAVAQLYEAEALWRGPALTGLGGRWAEATRAGLEEERRACALKRIGLELDLGHHAELLGELRRLSAQYPHDETCARYAMTALYRCGRQADALDVYRQVRDRLIDDQGIEPGPELVALHQRILDQDPRLSRPDAPRKSPSADHSPRLPLPATAFVGRAEEIRMLTAVGPETSRVRIISGLPGVGKTRLSLEVASRMRDRFPDGALYLEFHANDGTQIPLDTDGALRRLLEMAGVRSSALPRGTAEMTALWQGELATRKMIVVLDDVPDAASVAPLVPRDGSCCVFITARQRLHGIVGASELGLDVLPEQEAITLFDQVAGPGKGGDPDAAAQAVRACGHLPLAIALTASRLRGAGRSTTPEDPVEGATEFRIFPAETSEMGESLLSVLDASFQALTADEQRIFRFLGMNPCPSLTVGSAAAIADMPMSAAQTMIEALYDRHFVEHAVGGGFRLHDLLKDYAAFRAKRDITGSDRRDAERRLLSYYLDHADRADRDLYPHRKRTPLQATFPPPQRTGYDSPVNSREWLESEWRNALTVAEYAGRHEWKRHCAELAHVLAEFLDIRGYWDEAAGAHSHALRACRDLGDQSWTARALIDLSRACQRKGLRQDALVHAQDALDFYRSVGDRRGEASATGWMGLIYYYSGKFRESLAYGQDARSLYAQYGDLADEARVIFHCGISCMELGRLSESLALLRESLAIFERSGNAHSLARTLNSLGEVSRRQGYHREALENYRRALSIFRDIGARHESATVMQNIGQVYLYKGGPERALAEFRCALAAFREIGDVPWQARALCDCGDAYLSMDDYEQCLVYYQQAASIAERIGDLHVRVVAFRGIADANRGSDRPKEAMHHYREALKLVQEIGDPYQHATILDGIAKTMLRTGKADAGRIYLRQALDLYQASGAVEAKSAALRLQMLGDPRATMACSRRPGAYP
ncbi:MAG: tetratricopeptide repeat protein [Nocardiopsaceae bacterium]|nr:tetratricopeptide repeat protein [Nocardiopsaceae bacterium]